MKNNAKTIVCYGDSNTWGANPKAKHGTRYPRKYRWPYILAELLGQNYEVISEGLCGRTFVASDPKKPHRTGITHLVSILESHDPIDLVIITLGTNDAKKTYALAPEEIAADLEKTIGLIRKTQKESDVKSEILVVCPPSPVLIKNMDPRMIDAPRIFKTLPALFNKVSKKSGCYFLDAEDFISSSKIDGYHLDPGAHKKLAEILNKKIKSIL